MSLGRRHSSASSPLVHPLALTALVVLVCNDHWLKTHWPGWLSGKLSDVAGLVLLPLWLEFVFLALQRAPGLKRWPRPSPTQTRRAALLLAGVSFTLMQCCDWANALFNWGLGAVQWPAHAALSLLQAEPIPPLRPVWSIADVGDLLALPALALTALIAPPGRPLDAGASQCRGACGLTAPLQRAHRVTGLLCAVLALQTLASESHALPDVANQGPTTPARPEPAAAPDPSRLLPCPVGAERKSTRQYCPDRFFLQLELGAGWLNARSSKSVHNGFRQDIASTAHGLAGLNHAFYIGGTPAPGLVVGFRTGSVFVRGVTVGTLGQHVRLDDLQLNLFEFGAFLTQYLDPGEGAFLRGSINAANLKTSSVGTDQASEGFPIGKPVHGVSFTLGGGYEMWVFSQISLGLNGSLRYFIGARPGGTSAFGPDANLTFTWH